ncbi:hypothetical protein PhCBS80983_g04227 [Powellomyces hirtus]|uniref:RmlD-like substrate binding domain-containing protein n=1 Tax=Powellomyces hirtus TaxID=109895 RepID=A0A507DZ13_9FUNG|nr:hypothetical protein PhCBS80983_g04227 [Powellomyces hirtus]
MPLIASTPPKVLVTGASGLLGRAVYKRLREGGFDVIGTAFTRAVGDLQKLDLVDFEAMEAFVQAQRPNAIIHCAAERRPDVAQNNREAVLTLNVSAASTLAECARSISAWFLYISTDYVFDGTSPPYNVNDPPHPLNFYGETKLAGEQTVLEAYPDAAILRLPILYGETEYNSESAVNCLIDVIKDTDKPTQMDDFQLRYPTNVADIARVITRMTEKATLSNPDAPSSSSSLLTGPFHYSASETWTKYGMCVAIADILNLPIKHLDPLREAPKEPIASRPHDAHLATIRLEDVGIDTSHVPFVEWWRDYLLR